MTQATTDGASFTRAGAMRGARRLAPVALAAAPFAFAYGAAAIERGLTFDQAMLITAFVFAGASQFAALDVWASPPPYLSLALVVLAINARYLIQGAALSPWLRAAPPGPAYASLLLLTDASFADSQAAYAKGERDFAVFFGGGFVMWSVWVVSSAIGYFAAGAIDDLSRYGLDVVLGAFFALMTLGLMRGREAVLPAVVGAAAIVFLDGRIAPGWDVVVAAIFGGVAAAAWHGR